MTARNDLELAGPHLIVTPRGLDKVWGFRRRLIFPLERVESVGIEPRPNRVAAGIRAPGLDIG